VASIFSGMMFMKQNAMRGLIVILLGPVVARIYCELLIVIFSINGTLTEMKNLMEAKKPQELV